MEKSLTDENNVNAMDLSDLMSIQFPRDYNEWEIFSAPVAKRLKDIFKGRISSADFALFESEPNNPKCTHLVSISDDVIIEEAATLGPRILCSFGVLSRVKTWHDREKDGPELLERLFAAIVTSSRVRRGQERHPMTAQELYASRRLALNEMKALCKRLNALTVVQARLPESAELYTLIRDEIGAAGSYPNLSRNKKSLFDYLEQQDLDLGGNFTRQLFIRGSGVTPAEFVNGWLDWAFCTADGKSRNIISEIGNSKRS